MTEIQATYQAVKPVLPGVSERMISLYMDIAWRCSQQSRARRLQVGAVIVKDGNIISFGWNGTPPGWDNNCENVDRMDPDAGWCSSPEEIEARWPLEDHQGRYRLVTKPEVIHAEMNALMKLARNGYSARGATMFVTHNPCMGECAKAIATAGIQNVVYQESYRDSSGLDFLQRLGVGVHRWNPVPDGVPS